MNCEHCGKEDLVNMKEGFFWCSVCDRIFFVKPEEEEE